MFLSSFQPLVIGSIREATFNRYPGGDLLTQPFRIVRQATHSEWTRWCVQEAQEQAGDAAARSAHRWCAMYAHLYFYEVATD